MGSRNCRGYLFHTLDHGQDKRTMNYGVCVKGQNYSEASDESDFHGNVIDIIELQYQGSVGLKITIFKCEWYDPMVGRGTRHRDGGRIVDVLSTGRYPKYDPFILASQADQVCYIPYPSTKASRIVWLHVMKVNPRANIVGKYQDKEVDLLQQETDEEVSEVQDIRVGPLADQANLVEIIDFEVEDAEPEDEFHCNMSSSEDDEDESQDTAY